MLLSPEGNLVVGMQWLQATLPRPCLLAPRANHERTFTIEGPGKIVATDNGDPDF